MVTQDYAGTKELCEAKDATLAHATDEEDLAILGDLFVGVTGSTGQVRAFLNFNKVQEGIFENGNFTLNKHSALWDSGFANNMNGDQVSTEISH